MKESKRIEFSGPLRGLQKLCIRYKALRLPILAICYIIVFFQALFMLIRDGFVWIMWRSPLSSWIKGYYQRKYFATKIEYLKSKDEGSENKQIKIVRKLAYLHERLENSSDTNIVNQMFMMNLSMKEKIFIKNEMESLGL